ncbi:MAG: hypothetical protein WCO58_01810 [bacterium]
MENFNQTITENNQESEKDQFLSMEFFRKSLKKFKLASTLFLLTFGVAEAQQKEKLVCSTHNISITNEQVDSLKEKVHQLDSLSNVLIAKVKEHNLGEVGKTAPKSHWEVDSADNFYYKSNNTSGGMVMYENIEKLTNVIGHKPENKNEEYITDHKFICQNHKLYVWEISGTGGFRFLGVSNYDNPDSVRSVGDNFKQGKPAMSFGGRQYISAYNSFSEKDFYEDLDVLKESLEQEIKLIESK